MLGISISFHFPLWMTHLFIPSSHKDQRANRIKDISLCFRCQPLLFFQYFLVLKFFIISFVDGYIKNLPNEITKCLKRNFQIRYKIQLYFPRKNNHSKPRTARVDILNYLSIKLNSPYPVDMVMKKHCR